MQQCVIGGENGRDNISDIISSIVPLADEGTRTLSPLYKRLHSAMRNAIQNGVLGGGDVLPSDAQLSSAFGISTKSVKTAIGKLVGEGLVDARPGTRPTVSPRFAAQLSVSNGFSQDSQSKGHNSHFDLIDQCLAQPTEIELDMLELSPGDMVTRVHRIRYADDKPVCVEMACLPARILPSDADFSNSLYGYLAGKGLMPKRGVQRIRAELMPDLEADFLGVAANSPCLFVEQQSFLPSGEPIEYVRTHFRGDAYDFIVELKVGQS